MANRPQRSSRNPNPAYTFKLDTDFVVQDVAVAPVPKKRQRKSSTKSVSFAGDFDDESQATSPKMVKLTETRKNDILELLKRDMSQQSTVEQVGSAEHIRKVAGEVGVPPKELRKWLGITDDLTQVNVSSSAQFREKEMVPTSSYDNEPSKNISKMLDEEEKILPGKLHELEEEFQEEKPLLEEELVKLQQDIEHATELIEQVEEKQRLMGSDMTPIPITERNVPVLVETSVVPHGSELIDEEHFELARAEPIDEEYFEVARAEPFDDYMMGIEMPSIWIQHEVAAAAPVDDFDNAWVEELWDEFMKSENSTQLASQSRECDENDEVFEDALGQIEQSEQRQNEDMPVMDLKEVASSDLAELSLASSSVCHQSTDLEMVVLASVPNSESGPTFDVSNSTAGVMCENVQAEIEETVQSNHSAEIEETVQSNHSAEIEEMVQPNHSAEMEEMVQFNHSAENVGAEPEKRKERKSKVLVDSKITDYFKMLSRGKKEKETKEE